MRTDEKVMEYLERAERYACTPLGQRDPAEFKALMALKAEIHKEWRDHNACTKKTVSAAAASD